MKKLIKSTALIFAIVLSLLLAPNVLAEPAQDSSSGEHTHSWVENEDTVGMHCSICEIDKCEAEGHEQKEAATCTRPAVCCICEKEFGEKAPHMPEENAESGCAAEVRCKACGEVIKAAGQHQWSPASCTSPKHCLVCGANEGEALMHRWSVGTVTKSPTEGSPGSMRYICEDCGQIKNQTIYYTDSNQSSGSANTLIILIIAIIVLAGVAAVVYFVFVRGHIRKKH